MELLRTLLLLGNVPVRCNGTEKSALYIVAQAQLNYQ
jgi:hypothetical protein